MIEAGEYQVHNKPDYLSLTSNDEDLGQITVSDFTNNLQTLLGLSSDQVEIKFLFFLIYYFYNKTRVTNQFFILLVHLKFHQQLG